MGNLQIKNIPEDVHTELRRRAAQNRVTVRDYVLALLRADQELATTQDWLAATASRPPVDLTPGATLAALDAARDEREHDIAARR